MQKNIPYVKQTSIVDGKEVILNPITKDNPYLHTLPNVRDAKQFFKYETIYVAGFGWMKVKRSKLAHMVVEKDSVTGNFLTKGTGFRKGLRKALANFKIVQYPKSPEDIKNEENNNNTEN